MNLKELIETFDCKAPCFAFPIGMSNNWRVIRGCCNRWKCERCRKTVATKHYNRIVHGAEEIDARENKGAMEDLYFVTLTCRGKELSRDDAMQGYFDWTTKFLDACYSKAKHSETGWYYVQVTELQKRGHPHSHILINWLLTDSYFDSDNRLKSKWIEKQLARSGLGSQYDIRPVDNIAHVSRYIAKYLLKESDNLIYDFPPKWKRVRYSQSWPKLDLDPIYTIPLTSEVEWLNLYYRADKVDLKGETVKAIAEVAWRDMPAKDTF